MGIINQDRLVHILEAGGQPAETLSQQMLYACGTGYYDYECTWSGRLAPLMREKYPGGVASFDRESGLEVYAMIKDLITTNGYMDGKAMRPWEVDREILDNLDPNQPWWGFEFETGFHSREEMEDVINHVWDTWDGVTFDSEGEGSYASEITFIPSELSKYEDGTAPAVGFMKYLSDNKFGVRTAHNTVGTHLNLSLPEFRGESTRGDNLVGRVCSTLNATVAAIPTVENDPAYDHRLRLFGRSWLYAGFFNQGRYIEGKLFRTTYSLSEFERYMDVSAALTRVAQAAARIYIDRNNSLRNHDTLYADNFLEMVDDPSIAPSFRAGPLYVNYASVNGHAAESYMRLTRPYGNSNQELQAA